MVLLPIPASNDAKILSLREWYMHGNECAQDIVDLVNAQRKTGFSDETRENWPRRGKGESRACPTHQSKTA